MIQVGLLGASGRMGQWVTRLLMAEYSAKAKLTQSPVKDADLKALLSTDLIIDFSLPEAAVKLAEIAIQSGKGTRLPTLVVGSTGWKIEQRRKLDELSQLTPVLVASNFSTGVLALQEILKTAAPMLEKLGYSPSILETHHKHKKDAPSGTALSLQRVASPEGPGNVPIHSVRAGEIIGDHEITFYGPGDHITLGHFAQDRSIFARGAIEAGIWLTEKRQGKTLSKGLVTMETFFKERYL